MFNVSKIQKTDMSELENFPTRNFKTMEEQKTKKSQNCTGKFY